MRTLGEYVKLHTDSKPSSLGPRSNEMTVTHYITVPGSTLSVTVLTCLLFRKLEIPHKVVPCVQNVSKVILCFSATSVH